MTLSVPGSPASISSTDSNAPLPSFEDLAPQRPFLTIPSEETVLEVPDLPVPVRLKVDAGPGCGGIAWPAGEVLSRYLAYRHSLDPGYLRGKKILELGSGTGLVGIVAGLLEPTVDVWVTDQVQLIDLMQRNIAHNGVSANVHVGELNWGEEITGMPKQVDIVLAADCVYFEPAFPLLVQTLCDLAPVGDGPEILFCWKKRRKADKRFFTMLKKHFDSKPVEDDRPGEKERYTRDGVSLIRLTRRR
ncbi:putative methyltransferase-domain-containing protein [Papiliotrema laurentii]|uniref:Protein-lysine N-methyltransferase EFM6 n=1 Tax=Papiliotrema laurentii TaxID=5418 RepID=A0AAD9CWP1_PAPLA|nr:putative methyltransferase-domain-containing protein [Papiliotrema laurentii]